MRPYRGSSPLARGTPIFAAMIYFAVGLIPARAGNTLKPKRVSLSLWAHPRSRGEHHPHVGCYFSRQGSSPLARGTRYVAFDTETTGGLIPARAGNTPVAQRPSASRRAHPRSRGEHNSIAESIGGSWGSSPLARGTPGYRPRGACASGLIPARAGNTPSSLPCLDAHGAHPRSRGEHVLLRRLSQSDSGSSPLARGTQAPLQ